MILGIGLDLVELDRLRLALERTPRMAERFFTEEERRYCLAHKDPVPHFAARFAAKEAASKALGRGLLGLEPREIEVIRAEMSAPTLHVSGAVAERAAAAGIGSWMVTLTHSRLTAGAVVVALAAGGMMP